MENKTTTELLDLLWKIGQKADKAKDGSDGGADWDMYEEALTELKTREPFRQIIGEREFDNDEPTLEEKVAELLEDVKLLKRHKHDDKSNDVLIRI